jgi:hypothetical protein
VLDALTELSHGTSGDRGSAWPEAGGDLGSAPPCGSGHIFVPHVLTWKGVSFGLLGFATGLIVARLYLRLRIQKRRLLGSDLLMVATLLMGIPPTVLLIYLNGLGALEPAVTTTLRNFRGNPENISQIIKVYTFNNLTAAHRTM